MKYKIKYDDSIERELARIDRKTANRILTAIDALSETPRPLKCVKLNGEIAV